MLAKPPKAVSNRYGIGAYTLHQLIDWETVGGGGVFTPPPPVHQSVRTAIALIIRSLLRPCLPPTPNPVRMQIYTTSLTDLEKVEVWGLFTSKLAIPDQA
jgi:hypothetical protein